MVKTFVTVELKFFLKSRMSCCVLFCACLCGHDTFSHVSQTVLVLIQPARCGIAPAACKKRLMLENEKGFGTAKFECQSTISQNMVGLTWFLVRVAFTLEPFACICLEKFSSLGHAKMWHCFKQVIKLDYNRASV